MSLVTARTQMSPEEVHRERHLTAEEIAAYLTRAVATQERERMEAHLVACTACRDEVVTVRRTLRGDERPPWFLVAGGLAAAVLALVLLVPGSETTSFPGDGQQVLRDGTPALGDEGVPVLAVLSPASGAVVDEPRPVLSWSAADGEALYVVTVADGSGNVVWEERTVATSVQWPEDTPTVAGTTYYWYVDALVAGARSATTGVYGFQVR